MHELPYDARRRRRRSARARSAGRSRLHAVPRRDRARRRRAYAPRARVDRVALRGVPHAAHRLRRAGDPPQPPRRGAGRRARRRGGPPRRMRACHADRDAAWIADRMRDFWGARYRRPAAGRTAFRCSSPRPSRPCTRAIRCSGRCTSRRSAAPTARWRPARAGFALANTLVGLGDAYGAVRLARPALGAGARSVAESRSGAMISPPTTSRRAASCAIPRCRRCCRGSPPPRARTCRRRREGVFVTSDWQLDLSTRPAACWACSAVT